MSDTRHITNSITGSYGDISVLVVDDDMVNRRVAQKMLELLDVRIGFAANGVQAVEEVRGSDYDIVLMDCQMPTMNGYEATSIIKQDPQSGAPVIIAMTANAMPGDVEQCLNAGMDDYLPKPVRFEELSEKLGYWASRCRRGAGAG